MYEMPEPEINIIFYIAVYNSWKPHFPYCWRSQTTLILLQKLIMPLNSSF